jgi:hypothetical protein
MSETAKTSPIECPTCGTVVPEKAAPGDTLRCQCCGSNFVVPGQASATSNPSTPSAKENPMAKKKSDKPGGISISGGGNVSIGGDVVGGDKITTTTTITSGSSTTINIQMLADEVRKINQKIEALPDKDEDEKQELKETVARIETEVKKGEEAKPDKVERWLKFIAGMSEDILDVAVATFTNPALGIVEAVRKVAAKVKTDEAAKGA